MRVEIRYLCLHMLIPVAMACSDPPKNLSLHRGSHLWQQSVVAKMEKILLDKGWTRYLHPVYASHLPNVIGLDLKPHEEERQL